ncbi:MAG: sodium/hydrogen antiporter [Solirubrobacteraceae bacterium]|nr:sodium/hydrogen antiporter [Solirubrobacteraceae bacterium]
MTSFETGATVLGALLIVGALLSGIARRSFLSLTAVFVLVGVMLGQDGVEILRIDPRSAFVQDLALTALVLILFRDGLEVEAEMLQRAWRLPLRKLVLAMPITAGIVAVATKALTDLSWTEAFLVGALLSPTDPVLSSSVVTNPRVPRVIRHSLNLESGLNDGLALPPVLALTAALAANTHFVWWKFVLQDITLGVVYGLVVGYLASRLLPRGSALEASIPPHQRALYALGVAFLTYGLTTLPPHGNGVIAVFVCAIVLGIRRPDVRRYFESRADDIIEIVKLGVFVVFGSLLTFGGLFGDGWASVGVVAVTLLVARTAAVWVALAGTRLDAATKAFMAWFGPKGVATMTFSLLVLGAGIPHAERIFDLAALAVVCSVIVHGVTDTPGSEWIARRAERAERDPERERAPA